MERSLRPIVARRQSPQLNQSTAADAVWARRSTTCGSHVKKKAGEAVQNYMAEPVRSWMLLNATHPLSLSRVMAGLPEGPSDLGSVRCASATRSCPGNRMGDQSEGPLRRPQATSVCVQSWSMSNFRSVRPFQTRPRGVPACDVQSLLVPRSPLQRQHPPVGHQAPHTRPERGPRLLILILILILMLSRW